MQKDADYLFKVLILGDSSVGKTCLLLKYTEDKFTNTHMPTIGNLKDKLIIIFKLGIDFKSKSINIDN